MTPQPPAPQTLLRDAKDHWLANAVPSAAGPHIITDQADLARLVYAPMAQRRGITLKPPTAANRDSGEPVPVMVSANRWVVMCPDCGGAEFAWPDHFWFMCGSCFNVAVEGNWRPVVWPGDDEIAAVEDVLQARTHPLTRNWQPDREDVADLEEQNRERGEPERLPLEGKPERIKANRPARDKRGDAWREKVQKVRPIRGVLALPPGWDRTPRTVELPEDSPVGDTILYPDVEVPVMPAPVAYIPSQGADDGIR